MMCSRFALTLPDFPGTSFAFVAPAAPAAHIAPARQIKVLRAVPLSATARHASTHQSI